MTRIQTKCFGEMSYSQDAVFEFPNGLPGFEDERLFVFLSQPATHPLMFMQSLAQASVCFVLLPILAVDPNYQLSLPPEDLEALRLPAGRQPRIGTEVLCAAMVCTGGENRPHPTVNLLSPIVLNLRERIGIQAIQTLSGYSHRHSLLALNPQPELASCS
ncbi:MAG: flagellar assembly protein FliW [Bryobacteraceae bacterium]|jgi:flagellar assembly factor FliW